MFLQNIHDGQQIRPFGNGGGHIATIVKDRQPGTHTIPGSPDVPGVHLMVFQLFDHIASGAALIHQADKGWPKLTVGNILHHIPTHAAMDLLHAPSIPAGRNKDIVGITLHIHKNRANYNNSH